MANPYYCKTAGQWSRLLSIVFVCCGPAAAQQSPSAPDKPLPGAATTPQQEVLQLSGTVRTDTGDPLPGATLFIRGTFLGTSTNQEGRFEFIIPANVRMPAEPVLSVAYASYETQEIPLPQFSGASLDVVLASALTPLTQVVSAASRVEERTLQAPVTVEKVTRAQLGALPAPDLLRGLYQLKGVDVSAAGLLASSLSTRGFNSSTSERLVQLTDYFDTQAPSLSTNVGNLFGPSDLDIASVELLYGPASALYGANAFNGVLLFNTRDPFLDPGLSVRVRGGERNLVDGQLRFARKLGEKLAFKLTGGYLRAQDWIPSSEAATIDPTGPRNNPFGSPLGYGAVNRYGEVVNTFTPQQNAAFPGGVAPELYLRTVVSPGFLERDLVAGDDQARSWKVQPMLAYLLSSRVKATLSATLTGSTTGFQTDSRYRLRNFAYRQYRAEVKSEKWFVRASNADDASGDSYNLDFLGTFMQDVASPAGPSYSQLYFVTYNSTYKSERGRGATDAQALVAAQQAANATQLAPGSAAFNAARTAVVGSATPGRGARLDTRSQLTDVTAQHSLSLAQHIDLVVGGAYRDYRLGSNGTFFADEPGGKRLRNYEYGGYAQLTQTLLPKQRLKLSAAGRADAFQNFAAVFSPRVSAVYSAGSQKQHNVRLSYGQAFRSPTQANQYSHVDLGSVVLQGNVGAGYTGYLVPASLSGQFVQGVLQDPALLEQFVFRAAPLRLERLTTVEGGYRGLLFDKLALEAVYYRNFYRDFIGAYSILGNTDGSLPTRDQLLAAISTSLQGTTLRSLRVQANAAQQVQTHGVTASASYSVSPALNLGANYSFNQVLKQDELPANFQTFFNTPRHKYNASISGNVRNRVAYNLNYRWAQAHRYETLFAAGDLPDFSAVDLFLGYTLAPLKTTLQLGANNLLDNANQSAFGGPIQGRLLYVGLQLEVK